MVATEPVTYHIQSDSACMGILGPGSLADVVTETIIVTEYTEVELRTSEEGDGAAVGEDQPNVVQLVSEEIEVKMQSGGPVETRAVLVDPSHVSGEVVTVLEESLCVADSVNSQVKDTIVTIAKESEQSVDGGKAVDSLQNVSVQWESIPGAVVIEAPDAPQSTGTSNVMDADMKENAPCSKTSCDLAAENVTISSRDGEESDVCNIIIQCSQQNCKAEPSGSLIQAETLPSQKVDSGVVMEPSEDVSTPEVTEAPQTLTPRRGRGRPRKSEQKSSPAGTPRQSGRPTAVKKEAEDIPVIIPLSSDKE